MSKNLVLVTRSGRRRVISLPGLLLRSVVVVGSLTFLLGVLSLYAPVLHRSLGDWTGLSLRANRVTCARKIKNDQAAALINVLFASDAPPSEGPPKIELFVSSEGWSDLNRSILRFGLGDLEKKPRINATVLQATGKVFEAKVSYRGSNYWHHAAWKPSLRVRYKKDKIADGFRNHILIAPESPSALRNWLSSEMTRLWGALGPEEHHVRVFVNRRYLGLYTRQWRLDESLLCHQRRLPGPFFRLEHNTGPCFRRTTASFDQPETWEISGVEPAKGQSQLRTLLAACRIEDPQRRYEALDQIVDAKATARWLAVRAHSGETHVDDHNFALWLDTTSGRFVPILLDANGYGLNPKVGAFRPLVYMRGMLSKRRPVNPLEGVWLKKPQNLALYLEQLHELLKGFGSLDASEGLVRSTWDSIRASARADVNTSRIDFEHGMARGPYPVTELDSDVDALCETLRARIPWIWSELNDARVSVVSRETDRFEVLVAGASGVAATHKAGPRTALLPSLRQISESQDDKSAWAYAFFTLPGTPEGYRFENRLTGEALVLSPPPSDLEPWRAEAGLHPDLFAERLPDPIVLGPGEVRVTATRLFESGQSVTIRAGTQLRLGPDVSLLIRGPLYVQGTAARPVRVRPLDPERGFGVIALYGKESAGSQLSHLDCAGGSVARHHNLSFTGMISIHDCPGVTIEGSRFGETRAGDDTVHVARSFAEISSSTFVGIRSDALDWDKVTGRIEDCVFQGTGNDAIDASMSQLKVTRCRFEAIGDKAISAGEASQVRVEDCVFVAAEVGLAAKDQSRVWIRNSSFERCKIAVTAYMKKWRWERGGEVSLDEVRFLGSLKGDLAGDKRGLILTPQPRASLAIVGSVSVLTKKIVTKKAP